MLVTAERRGLRVRIRSLHGRSSRRASQGFLGSMHFFRVFLALSVAAVAWVASAIEETHFAFEGEDDADVVFQCNVPGRVRKSWSAYSKTEKKRATSMRSTCCRLKGTTRR